MGAIVEAVLWVLDLIIPTKDPRERRLQRLGCFLFGGFALFVCVVVVLDLYVFGG